MADSLLREVGHAGAAALEVAGHGVDPGFAAVVLQPLECLLVLELVPLVGQVQQLGTLLEVRALVRQQCS